MSGGGSFYKFRCRYFLSHECPNDSRDTWNISWTIVSGSQIPNITTLISPVLLFP
ncbi:hypothetical protein GGS24DRAFT_504758 [Hypoxylon argillaceum]|nr:hypothetical protein GGS24DRAFT_504758 [Hypoxylon argillaceum]